MRASEQLLCCSESDGARVNVGHVLGDLSVDDLLSLLLVLLGGH